MGKSFGSDFSVVLCTFIPLPENDYQDTIFQLCGIFTFKVVDGSSKSDAPLRPQSRTQRCIEEDTNPETGKNHQDLFTNKLYRPLKLTLCSTLRSGIFAELGTWF
ncbi:hypothetical protein DPMN_158179 [Dreissena polymorpha]|uniref:Uncharacterized protein n=1 Tax=Dreissena polymorpha TaxID=45954 RepID=A0A9D4ILR6_DREPO|nr:hypothetical protein DPMN_158179 [Dreissena polymorpha]